MSFVIRHSSSSIFNSSCGFSYNLHGFSFCCSEHFCMNSIEILQCALDVRLSLFHNPIPDSIGNFLLILSTQSPKQFDLIFIWESLFMTSFEFIAYFMRFYTLWALSICWNSCLFFCPLHTNISFQIIFSTFNNKRMVEWTVNKTSNTICISYIMHAPGTTHIIGNYWIASCELLKFPKE